MNARAAAVTRTVLRCAVYTRKSTEEGLEQAFNSLHAQRDACEAYVKSQVGEGWTALPAAYDDGGFSGGSMERPGLKSLLADIAAGLVDVVVVYKVDRLTRSLTDFARIVEQFDQAGVSFVSVTQAFNTTTSMGRLTLNVLLSFAQFEREVTGERIRDKIALSKAKGMWMGGVLPLGYGATDNVLVAIPDEAERVRMIFRRYLELGSVYELRDELNAQGVRSKAWVTSKGRRMGGAAFSTGALFHLLQNRHYAGEIVHKAQTHPGLHARIVDHELFEAVQERLAKNRVVRRRGSVRVAAALLTGRIFDGEGRPFSPTFSSGRSGRLHRYYVAADVQQRREAGRRRDAVRRVGADALEHFVVGELGRLADCPGASAGALLPLLVRLELRPTETHLVLDKARLFGGDHPDLAIDDLRRRLADRERLVEEPGEQPALRIALPRRMQLRGGRAWVAEGAPAEPTALRTDPAIVEALKRAHVLADGEYTAPTSPYDRKLLPLAYLAPQVQSDLLAGRQPPGLTLAALLRQEPPLSWRDQPRWLAQLVDR